MRDAIEFSAAISGPLATALLRTLWQGPVIACAVYVALRRIPAERPNLRYAVALAGLLGIVLAALVTWCASGYTPPEKPVAAAQADAMAAAVADASVIPAEARVAAVPEEDPALPAASPSVALPRIVIPCWLAGVVLMLFRVLRLMGGARRLRRECRPLLDNPTAEAALGQVKAALGVSRRVALLVADDLAAPVAMGLFWPAILLPTSMATGLPPEQIRAVLAHELAHIRRYDYLVNFVQLVVEALLYFNPAVWWLSRQVRVEREACCDALAARALGNAEALTRIGGHVHAGAALPSAAQGFATEPQHGGLLDRIRRLLSPGYRPRLCLRWYSLAAGALVTLAVLFGLYQSSVVGVALAGWFLSDEERIEVMAELSEKYVPEPYDSTRERESVETSGSIVTYDGKPLPDGRYMHAYTESGNHGIYESVQVDRDAGRFHGLLAEGETHIFAEFPGYAPAMLGPVYGDPEEPIEDLKLHLGPIHPVTIRFVTPSGESVPGVEASGGYSFVEGAGSSCTVRETSDEAGEVRIAQAADPVALWLRAKADGFQESRQSHLVIEPDSTFEWVLQPDMPIEGVVVDRETGGPIQGAQVALVYARTGGWSGAQEGNVVAESDTHGRFVLRQLSNDNRYYYLVRANGYGTEMIAVTPGQDEPLRVPLGRRYVRGVVRGDLSLLKWSKDGGGPVIEYSMDLEISAEHTCYAGQPKEIPVSVSNGEGRFRIDGLWAGVLTLAAGPKSLRVEVRGPVEDLVIDLKPGDRRVPRKVVFDLDAPEGAPSAQGRLGIRQVDELGRDHTEWEYLDVQGARAQRTDDAPAKIRVDVSELTGYIATPLDWDARHEYARHGWEVPAGTEPFVIDVTLERAGAIHGRVVHPDGTPARDARLYVSVHGEGVAAWPQDYLCRTPNNIKVDADGRFAVMPLPLTGEVGIRASIAFARVREDVKLTQARPVVQVELTIPEGVDVPVRVVDPSGQPMADTELRINYPGGSHSGMRTDAEGCYMLRGADPDQEYFIQAQPAAQYQYTRAEVPFDGSELTLQVREGLRASGSVRMEGTGAPVANVSVSADAAYDPATQAYRQYRVETATDSEGRFAFSNLCPGEFRIQVDIESARFTTDIPGSPKQFTAGQSDPVDIVVRPRE